jgi:hypothetical protein
VLPFWQEFLEAPNDVAAAVAARMARQVIHHTGKRFAVLLAEHALRSLVGTVETQIGQLDRLLAVMSLPSLCLGIIPLAAPRRPVASAGFWIFDKSVAALETRRQHRSHPPARAGTLRADVRSARHLGCIRASGPVR